MALHPHNPEQVIVAWRMLVPLLFLGFGAAADEHELSPGELLRSLEAYPSTRAGQEWRLVGPARVNSDGEVEIADEQCRSWLTLRQADIISSSGPIGERSACDGAVRPVISVRISGDSRVLEAAADPGSSAPALRSFARIGNVRIPGTIGSGMNALDWDWCVDWYLRCQLDCPESGLPIDSCLQMCDAIFDAACRR